MIAEIKKPLGRNRSFRPRGNFLGDEGELLNTEDVQLGVLAWEQLSP
jgi:hypothetical protein